MRRSSRNEGLGQRGFRQSQLPRRLSPTIEVKSADRQPPAHLEEQLQCRPPRSPASGMEVDARTSILAIFVLIKIDVLPVGGTARARQPAGSSCTGMAGIPAALGERHAGAEVCFPCCGAGAAGDRACTRSRGSASIARLPATVAALIQALGTHKRRRPCWRQSLGGGWRRVDAVCIQPASAGDPSCGTQCPEVQRS